MHTLHLCYKARHSGGLRIHFNHLEIFSTHKTSTLGRFLHGWDQTHVLGLSMLVPLPLSHCNRCEQRILSVPVAPVWHRKHFLSTGAIKPGVQRWQQPHWGTATASNKYYNPAMSDWLPLRISFILNTNYDPKNWTTKCTMEEVKLCYAVKKFICVEEYNCSHTK